MLPLTIFVVLEIAVCCSSSIVCCFCVVPRDCSSVVLVVSTFSLEDGDSSWYSSFPDHSDPILKLIFLKISDGTVLWHRALPFAVWLCSIKFHAASRPIKNNPSWWFSCGSGAGISGRGANPMAARVRSALLPRQLLVPKSSWHLSSSFLNLHDFQKPI